jgi:peroxiredoxin
MLTQNTGSFMRSRSALASFLMTVVATAAFANVASAQSPVIPRPLADVPIKTAKDPIDLKKYRGKMLVIGLMSTTCAHCATAMETLRSVQNSLGPKGLQVVAAVGDPVSQEKINAFAKTANANFPVGFLDQPQFMKLADLKEGQRPFVPVMLYVDRKGIIRSQVFGDDPYMRADVSSAILKDAGLLLKADQQAAEKGK